MSHGCMIGWIAPASPQLMSNETPLKTGPLTFEQLSWIGSINSIGAILSTFTFGFITLFLGCKRTILLLAVPSVIFFVLIFFGDTYYHILFARFMTGWSGGGIQTTLIIYIADVANNEWLFIFSYHSNILLLFSQVYKFIVQTWCIFAVFAGNLGVFHRCCGILEFCWHSFWEQSFNTTSYHVFSFPFRSSLPFGSRCFQTLHSIIWKEEIFQLVKFKIYS